MADTLAPRANAPAFKLHAQTRMSSSSGPDDQECLLHDDLSTSRGSYSWPVSGGCSFEESTPRLIPTPGYVSPASSMDTNREEDASSFSDHEVMAITKAKEFVNQLRLRFDVEPERYAVQHTRMVVGVALLRAWAVQRPASRCLSRAWMRFEATTHTSPRSPPHLAPVDSFDRFRFSFCACCASSRSTLAADATA